MTTLGDYCDVTMGQAPTGDTYNTEENGLPLLAGASDLGDVTPAPSRWTSAPTQVCEKGDIILCIRATIGDRNWADRRYCLGRGVAGLRAKPNKLEPRYLWHWIAASTPTLMHAARGATFLQVNRRDIENLPCSPPRSLAEQRRIADILDKADAIRRKRKEAIALTEELLRSAFLEMFGDPVTNPKSWPVKPLGELLDTIDSGWSPVCEARPAKEDEWGVLKLGAVTFGRYDAGESKALAADLSPVPELEVRAGDVLFSRKNTYDHVAACVFVANTRPKLMLPDLIFRLVLSKASGLRSETLWALLSNERMRKMVQGLAGGTAGSMPNISKERLKTVNLPVPPIALQERFAGAMRGNEATRTALEAAAAESEVLFNSLVARAFSGALSS